MAGNTKNLGQVSGVHIGNTPPSNIVLIWYDNTPSQKRHKVYDPTLQQWVVLDQNIISAITYSELVNIAKNTGLSVGEWFQITDRSNALALAVTSTKVQYSDAIGNILIDDLGTNIQYHVTSSNLSIDDVVGVFDEVNKKLVFQFNEYTPDYTADDYVFGKVRRNNIWRLAKYKLSSFLSKVTGNSITWNGGFFFSFSNELKNVLDKKGGIVSKDTYDNDKIQLETSINNVGKENQSIIQNAQNSLTKATSDEAIYGKKLPSIATAGEAIDVAKGDTLLNIVAKFQRWVNKFKYATGIRVSTDFADAKTGQYINNNDTVDSALRKLQYWIKNIYGTLTLSDEFEPATDSSGNPIPECAPGDTIETAISKLQGILNDIGVIKDGNIQSKQEATDYSTGSQTSRGKRMEIDLRGGAIRMKGDRTSEGGASADVADVNISIGGQSNISIDSTNGSDYRRAHIGLGGVYANGGGQMNGYPYNGESSAQFIISGSWGNNTLPNIMDNWHAGMHAYAGNSFSGQYPEWVYGAYIERLCAAGLVLRTTTMNDSDSGTTLSSTMCYYSCYNQNADLTLNLPSKPQKGQCLWIRQVNANGLVINGNGEQIIRNENSSTGVDSVSFNERGAVLFFVFDGNYWCMNKQNQ